MASGSDAFGADQPVPQVVARAHEAFSTGITTPLGWRIAQLRALVRILDEQHETIIDALRDDLGKPPAEGWLTELITARREIEEILRNIRRWSRTKRVRLPFALWPESARIRYEPLGVVLVVAPWNYPLNLVIAPMAAAIAAGNCVIAKPSELAPATSRLLARLVPQYLEPGAVGIVEGDNHTTQALIHAGVDHVFFTGSASVGRLIMQAAARHLTPVTLELGWKSPAVVDRDADVVRAARRIAWGKFVNAGQTCIAQDYVLVHDEVEAKFLDALQNAITEFYGTDLSASPDFARIVNDGHVERLAGFVSDNAQNIVIGGEVDRDTRYIAPTVLCGVGADDPVMHEEIFGPILPVIAVPDLVAAEAFLAARPTPLTMYVFSNDKGAVRRSLDSTRSGSVCVNRTLENFAVPGLPFGGLGQSGFCAYRGRFGFARLSHQRGVLHKRARSDLKLTYPPYTPRKSSILRRIL